MAAETASSIYDPAKLRTLKPETRSLMVVWTKIVAEHQGAPPQQTIAGAFIDRNCPIEVTSGL